MPYYFDQVKCFSVLTMLWLSSPPPSSLCFALTLVHDDWLGCSRKTKPEIALICCLKAHAVFKKTNPFLVLTKLKKPIRKQVGVTRVFETGLTVKQSKLLSSAVCVRISQNVTVICVLDIGCGTMPKIFPYGKYRNLFFTVVPGSSFLTEYQNQRCSDLYYYHVSLHCVWRILRVEFHAFYV